MLAPSLLKAGTPDGAAVDEKINNSIESRLIVPKNNGIKITGTFLDEISHDIPHQNWGEKEWDRDFRYMKAIGIDTVIVIRSGYRKFITYPSPYLLKKGCYMPSVDYAKAIVNEFEFNGELISSIKEEAEEMRKMEEK